MHCIIYGNYKVNTIFNKDSRHEKRLVMYCISIVCSLRGGEATVHPFSTVPMNQIASSETINSHTLLSNYKASRKDHVGNQTFIT